MKFFAPIPNDLLFSRHDQLDPRLGEIVQLELANHQLTANDVVIAGYPDDEGIRLNGGRPGAAQGPDAIRRFLYRLTPPATGTRNPLRLFDLGNLQHASDLATRHTEAQRAARQVMTSPARWLSFGGGHDYGFPDTAAFVDAHQGKGPKPLVINLDAHLDVRSTDHGLTSGTPFYRLLNEFHGKCDLVQLGVQAHCNSQHHRQWCEDRGVRVLFWEDLMFSGEAPIVVVSRFLESELQRPRPAFLSIDIDGFSSSIAMGCSQSWATGWRPEDFLPVMNLFLARWQVRGLGIYEVSPPLDNDQRTAKWAAQLAHRFIFSTPS